MRACEFCFGWKIILPYLYVAKCVHSNTHKKCLKNRTSDKHCIQSQKNPGYFVRSLGVQNNSSLMERNMYHK